MATYRERREARAERLRQWADSRDRKADAAYNAARQTADSIPFGQPMLTDHYSYRGDRNRRDRMRANFERSHEHAQTAERMRARADSIDAQAARAIYSDDPDARERLAERIAELEAERDRIKAYNATCRKGTPDLSVLDDRQRAALASTARHAPYQLGKGGAFPAYALSNLAGNIARLRKRLDAMPAPAVVEPASSPDGCRCAVDRFACHVCGCDISAAGCSPGDGHRYCPDHVPHEVDLATARTCAACARGEHTDHALGVWYHANAELREVHGGQVCPCERCGGLDRQRAYVDEMRAVRARQARERTDEAARRFAPWLDDQHADPTPAAVIPGQTAFPW